MIPPSDRKKAGCDSLATLLNERLDEVLGVLLEDAVDLVEDRVHIGISGRGRSSDGIFGGVCSILTPGVDWLSL